MLSAWEAQFDSLMEGVSGFWHTAREKQAEGRGPLTQVEEAVFVINDQEILASSELYFSALATITPVMSQLDAWEKAIGGTVGPTRSAIDVYRQALPQLGDFVDSFAGTTESVAQAHEHLSKVQLPRLKAELLLPIKAELAGLDALRSRVVRLRYKVEQLEKAQRTGTLQKVIDGVKPEWMQSARAELEVAKPTFIEAVKVFMAKWRDRMTEILQHLVIIRREFMAAIGGLQAQPQPPVPSVDYGDVDAILAVLAPEQT
jgi:hypothetical protein